MCQVDANEAWCGAPTRPSEAALSAYLVVGVDAGTDDLAAAVRDDVPASCPNRRGRCLSIDGTNRERRGIRTCRWIRRQGQDDSKTEP